MSDVCNTRRWPPYCTGQPLSLLVRANFLKIGPDLFHHCKQLFNAVGHADSLGTLYGWFQSSAALTFLRVFFAVIPDLSAWQRQAYFVRHSKFHFLFKNPLTPHWTGQSSCDTAYKQTSLEGWNIFHKIRGVLKALWLFRSFRFENSSGCKTCGWCC